MATTKAKVKSHARQTKNGVDIVKSYQRQYDASDNDTITRPSVATFSSTKYHKNVKPETFNRLAKNWQSFIQNSDSFANNDKAQDGATVAGWMSEIVTKGQAKAENLRVLTDKDGKSGLAASVVVEDKENKALFIEYLMTSPSNLVGGGAATLGAGTTQIENHIYESMNMGYGGKLRLSALPRARPFYQKIGFEDEGDGDNSMYMSLSPEKAKEFLKLQMSRDVSFSSKYANSITHKQQLLLLELQAGIALAGRPPNTSYAAAQFGRYDDVRTYEQLAPEVPRKLTPFKGLKQKRADYEQVSQHFRRKRGLTKQQKFVATTSILAKRNLKRRVLSPTGFVLDMGDEVGRGLKLGKTPQDKLRLASKRAKRTVTRAQREVKTKIQNLQNLFKKGKVNNPDEPFLTKKQLKQIALKPREGNNKPTPNPFHRSKPFFYRVRDGKVEKVKNRFFNLGRNKKSNTSVLQEGTPIGIDYDNKKVLSAKEMQQVLSNNNKDSIKYSSYYAKT